VMREGFVSVRSCERDVSSLCESEREEANTPSTQAGQSGVEGYREDDCIG
jgi:hypothetical protein